MIKKGLFLLLILSFCSSLLYSQDQEIAIPYKPDEFPQWTLDLRRAEIVTIGSFPLSFMFTAIIYDLTKSASAGFDPTIPFGSSRSQEDIKNMLIISGGVSLAVGLTDFIIQQKEIQNRLLTMDGETVVLPGHGPPSTIQAEREINENLFNPSDISM